MILADKSGSGKRQNLSSIREKRAFVKLTGGGGNYQMENIQFTFFTLIFLLVGLFIIWFSLFGKKKDIDEMGFFLADNLIELIVGLAFTFSPAIIKRVLIFVFGFLWSLLFGILFIKSLSAYFN
ncbi:hypothetical protein [Parageobacillus toebii]|nr:hypothetical protein [Parageobacillus toebii]WMT18867.1 hypothetical protein RFB12_16800 [Parageobacillus toebii]